MLDSVIRIQIQFNLKGSETSSPRAIGHKFGVQVETCKQPKDVDQSHSGRFGQSARHQFYQQGAIQGQHPPHKYVNVRQEHSIPRVFQPQGFLKTNF